ncbi:MAG: hypothetical protein ABI137_13405 [Antricoccus sp.]
MIRSRHDCDIDGDNPVSPHRIALVTLIQVVAVILILSSAACLRAPTQWAVVTVPSGVHPASLTSSPEGLFVGGTKEVSGRVGPVLLLYRAGVWMQIPLHPKSGYGHSAALVQLSVSGSQIVAIGDVTGGAHLNPRWSIWVGDIAGLDEQPQGMETFGGEDGGNLNGIVAAPTPMIVGNYSISTSQIGVAVWTNSDALWTRPPLPPEVTGSAGDQTSSAATSSLAEATVVVGLAAPVSSATPAFHATAWLFRAGAWRRVEFGPANSAALSVSCGPNRCLVTGLIDQKLALWSLTEDGKITTIAMPPLTVPLTSHGPHTNISGNQGVVISPVEEGQSRAFSYDTRSQSLRKLPDPPAIPEQLAIVGTTVYILTAPQSHERSAAIFSLTS